MIDVVLQAALVPVITGVVQVFKTAGVPSRVAPLLSLGLGVIATIGLLHLPMEQEILQGVVLGLAASGFYSGIKTQFEQTKSESF